MYLSIEQGARARIIALHQASAYIWILDSAGMCVWRSRLPFLALLHRLCSTPALRLRPHGRILIAHTGPTQVLQTSQRPRGCSRKYVFFSSSFLLSSPLAGAGARVAEGPGSWALNLGRVRAGRGALHMHMHMHMHPPPAPRNRPPHQRRTARFLSRAPHSQRP